MKTFKNKIKVFVGGGEEERFIWRNQIERKCFLKLFFLQMKMMMLMA